MIFSSSVFASRCGHGMAVQGLPVSLTFPNPIRRGGAWRDTSGKASGGAAQIDGAGTQRERTTKCLEGGKGGGEKAGSGGVWWGLVGRGGAGLAGWA